MYLTVYQQSLRVVGRPFIAQPVQCGLVAPLLPPAGVTEVKWVVPPLRQKGQNDRIFSCHVMCAMTRRFKRKEENTKKKKNNRVVYKLWRQPKELLSLQLEDEIIVHKTGTVNNCYDHVAPFFFQACEMSL